MTIAKKIMGRIALNLVFDKTSAQSWYLKDNSKNITKFSGIEKLE